MLIVYKVKEKATKWGKKEYDEKRIGKILIFKSYISLSCVVEFGDLIIQQSKRMLNTFW